MSVNGVFNQAAAVATVGASRLSARVEEPRQKLAWVWVLFLIVVMVAAAVAFAMCLSRGYRGFAGHWRVATRLKIPVGIDLACY